MTNHEPLTIATVVALNAVLETAMQSARVARARNDGDIIHGTARSVVYSPDNPANLVASDDVRDAYLWITLRSGFETYWPIAELIGEVQQGLFAAYDWSTR